MCSFVLAASSVHVGWGWGGAGAVNEDGETE